MTKHFFCDKIEWYEFILYISIYLIINLHERKTQKEVQNGI